MQLLIIAGNVGKDAVLRRTANGDPVLNFTMAVDNGKDREGNKRDTTWFDCAIWGKRAEALERHIVKGLKLVIQGRPTGRVYEGKIYLGVNVQDLTFMGGGNNSSDRNSDQQQDGRGPYMDDEIPFSPEWRA